MKNFLSFVFALSLLCGISELSYAQSSGYRTFVEQGTQRFNAGDYDKAIKFFNAAMADTKATQAEKAKAKQWVNKCKAAKQEAAQKRAQAAKEAMEKFEMSIDTLSISSSGGDTLVSVKTNNAWKVVSSPQWCSISDNIYDFSITVKPNLELTERSGVIVIETIIKPSKKKQYTINHELVVYQGPREMNSMMVTIKTKPLNAEICINESEIGESGKSFSFKEGTHKITIKKTGYQPLDTTVIVKPFDKVKSQVLDITLVPSFAIAKLSIIPEEGTSLTMENKPVLRLDNHTVNMLDFLDGSATKSFDDEGTVEMFGLYTDNMIPVPEGRHIVSVSALDFENYTDTIDIEKGITKEFVINLVSKSGTLVVNNVANADSCLVYSDKKVIGYAPGEFRLTKGLHTITFSKDGYSSSQTAILAEIEADKQFTVNLEMFPFVRYSFFSNPDSASVYLDGNLRWTTPVIDEKVTCGEHQLKLEKKGYLTVEKTIVIGHEDDTISLSMIPTSPLEINADLEGLHVILTNKQTGMVLMPETKTNGVIEIPHGRYTMELRRFNKYILSEEELKKKETAADAKDLAYKGRLNFNDRLKRKNILTFREKVAILGGTYYVNSIQIPSLDFEIENQPSQTSPYTYMGSVDLFKFRIFPGYSTSLIKASVFNSTDSNKALLWGASILFLNGEFRLGGAISQHLDCDIVGSYNWMPKIHYIKEVFSNLTIPYVSGTDLFFGAEISTRINAFNVNIKAGEQFLVGGNCNVYNPKATSDTKYVSQPFNSKAFVISLGFTLGANRGNAMIRLF